ncbi:N-acetylglucosamine-6-phosphate deacetylase [Pseudonocardia endophytica]|uniref:N-acetylglucosamine 6-phosphate deacetylase n=1 Tax=Pseudonocardia endophytica TaxID=401976 RepID=A0A4R1HSN1_PSEEN|nr:N-acetylglucosamine-6-phosphate deacetylase [Pseudonocardia endophytica]TCK24273.1 N-acetylglucosamine 6-phosphate deacetylase [Pseudonocardia endophytica]
MDSAPPDVVAAGTLVTGEGDEPGPGWVAVADGRVSAVGTGPPPHPPRVSGAVVVPGFVDLHQHGGNAGSFPSGDPEEAVRAVAFHRAHGTTTSVASLVTDTPSALERTVHALSGLVDDGELAGLHLEGPWLAAARCGAHSPSLLRDPDPAELDRLLARGTVAMVTLAPERDGALDAVRRVVGAGGMAAVGHTDADHDTVRRAIDAGARVGTHLFNAMAPLDHRRPGPAGALLADPRVVVEIIADGVHLHPAVVDLVLAAAPGRVAAVTDAISAAGMPDGPARLGPLPVTVRDGIARVTGTETLAGSTATSDVLFRTLAASGSLARAVAATSTTPAAVLGLDDVGVLRPGARADLVVLDDDLTVRHVRRRGRPV